MKSLRSFSLWRKIHHSMQQEIKLGYTNSSIQGGFTATLFRILQEPWFKEEYPHEKREQLHQTLEQYALNSNEKTFANVDVAIGDLQDFWNSQIPASVLYDAVLKPLTYVKGFGPRRVQLFAKLGVTTLYDVLHYFPKSWVDRSQVVTIQEAYHQPDTEVHLFATVRNLQEQKKSGFVITTVTVSDTTGILSLVFINQKYQSTSFQNKIGSLLFITGKIQFKYGKNQMTSPEYEFVEKRDHQRIRNSILPVYGLTDGLTQNTCRNLIKATLSEQILSIHEYIPYSLRSKESLMHVTEAICSIHFPLSLENKENARQRLVFDQFLLNQYMLQKHRRSELKQDGYSFVVTEEMKHTFFSFLPFSLTSDQEKVVNECIHDVESGYPMNRLLHGDVGSGKTVVAAALCYLTVKNGYQAVFMAPTEILARQVFLTMKKLFEKDPSLQVMLLISDQKKKERESILLAAQTGEANIIVGTHAVIQEAVVFSQVGTIIVDEQHRFGVEQRNQLIKKSKNPHVLVMSATPIPRTIALTRYGDLDTSVIQVLPRGIRKVTTKIVTDGQKKEMYYLLHQALSRDEKIYFVCPLIEESESLQIADSISKAEELKVEFPEALVLLLHGRMKAVEKEGIINQFQQTSPVILVSTTVIEVGVDVPEATVMVIENAERFGLAQLHQLRGRVGRKSQEAFCFLVTQARDRLEILEQTSSGFVIAEKDLLIRGPGDIFGSMQSGFLLQDLIQIEKDYFLIEKAQKMAIHLLDYPTEAIDIEKEIVFRNRKMLL